MTSLLRLGIQQSYHLGAEIVALSHGPWPIAKMCLNGLAIGTGFLGLMLAGKPEDALICAFFTNLMMFTDQQGPLGERLAVLALAAAAGALCGLYGALASQSVLLVFMSTFGLAFFAGLIHGSVRGIDMIPRFAAICFVAGAYLPVVNEDAVLAVVTGSFCALAGVVIDDLRRKLRREASIKMPRLALIYPGMRFSLAYGLAAICGLGLGLAWGDTRPYWLTITTLLVMQPDRRTNMFRALQRFLGTMGGVLAAFAVVFLLPEASRFQIIVWLCLFLPFLWPLAYARNYSLGVAVLTIWILLLLDLVLPASQSIGVILAARFQDTAAGCVLALAGAFIYNKAEDADL